jgi:hypothetical protein
MRPWSKYGSHAKRRVREAMSPELKHMAMCLELGDNSIRYTMGIIEDVPMIKLGIYDERSAFKFQPRLRVCNAFNVKYIPPHLHFMKEEPKKKEELEKETKVKEVVASVKTKE